LQGVLYFHPSEACFPPIGSLLSAHQELAFRWAEAPLPAQRVIEPNIWRFELYCVFLQGKIETHYLSAHKSYYYEYGKTSNRPDGISSQ
jgi:hypothetical protein